MIGGRLGLAAVAANIAPGVFGELIDKREGGVPFGDRAG
jgi:hypothetical protein